MCPINDRSITGIPVNFNVKIKGKLKLGPNYRSFVSFLEPNYRTFIRIFLDPAGDLLKNKPKADNFSIKSGPGKKFRIYSITFCLTPGTESVSD